MQIIKFLINVSMLILILFTNGFKCKDELHWRVLQKVSKFGEDLSLICLVENCCDKRAGWGKWIPNFKTIFIDVKDLTRSKKSKYTGWERRNGFLLIIRRLNESDLNIQYSCTYGFEVSRKQVLLRNMTIADKDNHGGVNLFVSKLLDFILYALVTGIVVLLVCAGCYKNKRCRSIMKQCRNKCCCRENIEDTGFRADLQVTGNRRDQSQFGLATTDDEEESIL